MTKVFCDVCGREISLLAPKVELSFTAKVPRDNIEAVCPPIEGIPDAGPFGDIDFDVDNDFPFPVTLTARDLCGRCQEEILCTLRMLLNELAQDGPA
jgi:hypothetical protein